MLVAAGGGVAVETRIIVVGIAGTGVAVGLGVGSAWTFRVTPTVAVPALEVIAMAPVNNSAGAESFTLTRTSPSPTTCEEGSISSS